MHVCVYVGLHVHVGSCAYLSAHTHTCVCTHAHTHKCKPTRAFTYLHVFTQHTHIICVHVHVCTLTGWCLCRVLSGGKAGQHPLFWAEPSEFQLHAEPLGVGLCCEEEKEWGPHESPQGQPGPQGRQPKPGQRQRPREAHRPISLLTAQSQNPTPPG